MKFFWIFKAFRVMSLIAAKVPKIMADGVVTPEEGFGLLAEVLMIFDLNLKFKVPETIAMVEVDIREV